MRTGMAPVHLAMDHVIGPRVLAFGHWHDEQCQMLRDKLTPSTNYHLVDVDTNDGLVSRQMLISPGLRFIGTDCFEPDSHNHSLLKSNLAAFDAVRTHAAALSDHDGFADLFRGSRNAGGISLAPTGKLRARHDLRSSQVALFSAERVGEEILDALAPETRLVWKSDTQGHDVKIVAALSAHFLHRVDAALIEAGSVTTAAPEMARFMGVIDSFSRHQSIKFGANTAALGDASHASICVIACSRLLGGFNTLAFVTTNRNSCSS